MTPYLTLAAIVAFALIYIFFPREDRTLGIFAIIAALAVFTIGA